MPTIQTYDGAPVRTDPLNPPLLQAPGPDAFGAQLGRAAEGVGSELFDLAAREKDKAEHAALFQSVSELTNARTEALSNSKTGALTTKGRNATGVADRVTEQLDATAKAIAGRLANPDVRMRFNEQARGIVQEGRLVLAHHELQQTDEADKVSFEAGLEAQRSAAANLYTQEPAVAGAVARTRELVDGYATSSGWDKTARDGAVAAAVSKVYRAALASFPDTDPTKAAEFFKLHEADMTPEDRDAVRKTVEVADLRQTAQEAADAVWSGAKGDLSSALDTVGQIPDVTLREETRRRVLELHQDHETVQSDQEKAAIDTADSFFKKSGRVSGIPTSAWAALSTKAQEYFRGVEDSRTASQTKKTDPNWSEVKPEDMAAWYAYQLKTPQERLDRGNRVLVDFSGKIPREAVVQMVDEQKSIHDAIESGRPERLTQILSDEDLVANTAKRAGILDWSKPDDKKLARFAAYRTAASEQIRQFEREKLGGKGRATQEEMQPILDRLAIHGALDTPWWHDPKVYAFEAGADPRFRADIPDAERTEIVDALKRKQDAERKEQDADRAAGRPVKKLTAITPERIQGLFRKAHGLAP